ncbi:MAG: DUF2188 domain-containing protein [Cytophagaceae bacterium]
MLISTSNIPASYCFLKPEIRKNAILIAGKLISEDFDESVSFTVAYLKASCFGKNVSEVLHLIPHKAGWGLISEKDETVFFTETHKNEAIKKARVIAKSKKARLTIHYSDSLRDVESFEVNRPAISSRSMKITTSENLNQELAML